MIKWVSCKSIKSNEHGTLRISGNNHVALLDKSNYSNHYDKICYVYM